jgi:hypothetical protein
VNSQTPFNLLNFLDTHLEVMQPSAFATALSQLKQDPAFEEHFQSLAFSAPTHALANFITIAIDPTYSDLAQYSLILLSRFAFVLTDSI